MPIQNLILFIAWEADTERTAGECPSLQLCRHERTLITSEHEDLIVYSWDIDRSFKGGKASATIT